MATPLRFVIIGAGALPVACADLLRERGHQIVALVSPDRRTQQWGRSHGVACARMLAGLPAVIEGQPFDYLLSIVNFRKLPASLLAAPRCHAINYHDAPLPRYAGSHALTWALMHGETRHAVSWHVMTDRVDAGDVLVQTGLDIDPDDTVLTLNLKCHEAALSGFRVLLDAMEAGALVPHRQDLDRRTFFPRGRCPTAGCVLPFDAPAEYLLTLLRALDFGPYPNPLGLPKIALGESFALVTELDVLEGRAKADTGSLAGSIRAIAGDGLVVATATQDVVLGGFLTLEGVPLSIPEVVERGRLHAGGRMPSLGAERAARLATLCEELSRHEPFWNTQLAKARPVALPGALRASTASQRVAQVDVPMDASSRSFVATLGLRQGDGLLTVFVALLARMTGSESVDIGFDDARLRADIGDLHTFFSTCLPLRVAAAGECGFARFAQGAREQLARVRARRTHARDLPVRNPALRARLETVVPSTWPVVVEMLERADEAPPASLPGGRMLTLRLGADGDVCRLLYDPEVLAPALVKHVSCQFASLLQALPDCGAGAPLRDLPLLDTAATPRSGGSSVSAF